MSIKNHAMLVSLSVRKPQMTMKDAKATRDAEAANDAHNAGQFRKDLYPKQLIQPILTVESSARAYIESTTYVWARGDYLLPNKRFMVFADRMAKYELEFSQCVTAFLNNWNNVMQRAQDSQGDMFNPSVYPDLDELKAGFRMKVCYRPVTDYGDFRVQLQTEELDMLRMQVEAEVKESMESVYRDPLTRLRKVVAHLQEVTGKQDRVSVDHRGVEIVKPPIFRDSVVENVHAEIDMLMELADVMPARTVNLAKRIGDMMPAAQVLRDDSGKREELNENTKHLLTAIDAMLED
jgi:hypothetical protein